MPWSCASIASSAVSDTLLLLAARIVLQLTRISLSLLLPALDVLSGWPRYKLLLQLATLLTN